MAIASMEREVSASARALSGGLSAEGLEASTRWQMRQSWATAMDKLQKTLADQEMVPWNTVVDESLASGVTRQAALMTPSNLKAMVPMSSESACVTLNGRREAQDIIHLRDDRLLVVVGPCSIHDPAAAMEYARKLKSEATRLSDDLCIVMRAYFEKPRTTIGWKGLISDPNLDGSSNINKGLRIARQLSSEITSLGLPIAGEILDPLICTYLADFLSIGAIGARTTESQPHRALCSSLPFPIGFKNGTDGGIDVAVNSLSSASGSHTFPALTDSGVTSIYESTGNPDCFVILRGGARGPNYSAKHVDEVQRAMFKSGYTDTGVMVDCSHGNSDKDYRKQTNVVKVIAEQVEADQNKVVGVMIESNLCEGKQSLDASPVGGAKGLLKGVSVTDGCIGWDATVEVLDILAAAARLRRSVRVNRSAAEMISP